MLKFLNLEIQDLKKSLTYNTLLAVYSGMHLNEILQRFPIIQGTS